MTSSPSPDPPRGVTRQDVFSVLGALGAVLTLVTAVMFYFGWQRSAVQAREMSIDVSLFGYSSQDYVLRSISSLYLPMLVLLCMGLGWLWVHGRVVALLGSDAMTTGRRRAEVASWTRRLAIAGAAVAAGSVLFAVAAGTSSPPSAVAWLAAQLRDRQWVVPLILVISTLVACYAWWIHRRLQPSPVASTRPLWQSLLPSVLIAGAVVLGAFWMLEEYAAAVGRGYAHQLAAGVDALPHTVVISPTPLGIEAPGVDEERLGAPDSPEVRYRTTGLRLLARSGGKVLLVHDGWSPETGRVIVLADSDQLGWQFSR